MTKAERLRYDFRHHFIKACPECQRKNQAPATDAKLMMALGYVRRDILNKHYSYLCLLCGWSTNFFYTAFGAFRAWQLAPIAAKPLVEERHLQAGKFKNCYGCQRNRSRHVPQLDRSRFVRLTKVHAKHHTTGEPAIRFRFRCLKCNYTPPGISYTVLRAFVLWNRYIQEG